ncbi:uncharacterized protein LOC123399010 [Hordeum vulgare subsp. vulgare]|uniref:uncharacterized protein LOC123399010 n=1 Tax=Hordeum vulgare subsp. vulgare TaxID=112509 RepID=UPI001D1A5126|nr:uncharacterized protein LOC123399010 [Hordeum vulgare subsp. vulgare]KAI5017452.1 hypothetical protein ZWY2020_042340 [Hordeum vulgare]
MASLFSLCLMALLLSTASALPSRASPAAGSVDGWLHEELPAAAPGGSEESNAATATADGIAVPPPPPGRQRFRTPPHPFALSPEARRGLEHEARCGPRVPVRRSSPWPEWKPRCRGDDDGDAADVITTGAAGAPAPAWLPLDGNEP